MIINYKQKKKLKSQANSFQHKKVGGHTKFWQWFFHEEKFRLEETTGSGRTFVFAGMCVTSTPYTRINALILIL